MDIREVFFKLIENVDYLWDGKRVYCLTDDAKQDLLSQVVTMKNSDVRRMTAFIARHHYPLYAPPYLLSRRVHTIIHRTLYR